MSQKELVDRIIREVGDEEILRLYRNIFCLCPECRVKDVCERNKT